ncbi:MAG: hypothetical protein N2443_09135 [Blastocatellia bacterium]|nr:hypothetical protein [Blastocatellia bacterium]
MRILIIHVGALGDCLFTLPALAALAQRFPGAYMELAGSLVPHGLLERRSPISRVVSIEALGLYRAFTGELPEDLATYLRRFDVIISWFGHNDEAYRRALTRLGHGECAPRLIIASSRPPAEGSEHAVDHLLSTLAPLGIAAEDRTPRLALLKEDHEAAERMLRAFGIEATDDSLQLIAIHPGSGSRRKCWPVDRFARLLQALDRSDRTFLLIEGPADRDVVEPLWTLHAAGDRAGISPRLVRVTNAPLPQLAAVLARSHLFVGHDSGVTHLAASVGTPVIALFIATDPRRWGPRGPATIVQGDPSVEDVRALCERVLEAADLTRRPRSRTDPIRSSCLR